MIITTLYKVSTQGKLQKWLIELEGNKFRTTEGYANGKMTTTNWTECEGKRIGFSNETSPSEQAAKEVQSKIEKQKKKGWTEVCNNVHNAARKHLPMLAKKYEDVIEKLLDSTQSIALQPKLDGIRMIVSSDLQGWTREGNKHNPSVNHLLKECDFIKGTLETSLDGEIYNHELKADFNQLASIVRKQKLTERDVKNAEEKLQYHIYDINTTGSFAARFAALKMLIESANDSNIKLVKTEFISTINKEAARKAIDQFHRWCIENGYEGSMIRDAQASYQPKRSSALLKRKDWIDNEFEIVDFVEGKGNKTGMAASVICKDARGEEFSAGIIGEETYCKILLMNKNLFKGKKATIKYQNLTPDRQVPRFGKMKVIRDYE